MALAAHVTNAPPGSWVAKGAQEQDIEGQRLSLNWTTLTAQQLRGQWLIALHPDFALYSKRLGLVLGLGAPPDPVQMSEPAPILRYQYEFEPWSLHAERIAVQARGMRNSYERAAVLLANYYNVPPEAIEELSEVVCILHDVGKLGEEWQRRAWLWQNDKDSRMRALGYEVPIRSKVPLAHTWFDTVADREFQRQSKYSLPHHAGEGAWAVSEGMFSILRNNHPAWGDVAAASACSAIARHHSPRSSDFQPFRLSDKAQTSVTAALPGHWRGLELKSGELRTDAASFAQELLKFSREEDECAWPLYTFLVRRLRLADQASLRSTKRHTSPL
jgi:CRISPR-associated endonuclease/helicase Cas3